MDERTGQTESGREFRPIYRPSDLAGFDPDQRLGEPGAYPFTRGQYIVHFYAKTRPIATTFRWVAGAPSSA